MEMSRSGMDQRAGRNAIIRRERACVTELVRRPANLARLVERVHPKSAETFAPTTPADLIGSG